MTDVSDIVDVVVRTPRSTADHCFVSCMLRLEQSVPEYNDRSTVFLKHRTNWDRDRCTDRSFTWSTILKAADPLVAFRAISEVILGMFLPLFFVVDLETSNGLMPAAPEFMMLNRLLIVPDVDHAMRNIGVNLGLLVLRHRWSMVLQGSRIMSTPGILRSTPPKWWETLKGSIFGVKPSILALRGPGGGLVEAPSEKTSLLGSQFDTKQYSEQFVTPLCVPQSRCNSLAFRTSVLLRLLLDLDSYGGVDPLSVFPLFLMKVAAIIAPKLSIIFCMLVRL